MNHFPTILACNSCMDEFVFVGDEVPVYYQLSELGRFQFNGNKAWCCECNSVVDAERRLSALTLKKDIDALKKTADARTALDKLLDLGQQDREIAREIRNKETLLRISEYRETAPRCLRCSGTKILPLNIDDAGNVSNITHRCGGKLFSRLVEPDSAMFAWGRIEYTLSPEGRTIRSAPEAEMIT